MSRKSIAALISIFTISSFLSSCATNKVILTAELQNELDTALYCAGEKQCKTMWERATYFVNSSAGFKLQIHNDTIIQTYNPTSSSPRLAFSITKEPLGGGKYQIWTSAWCDNMFGCIPDKSETMARAKRYMRTGKK